MLRNSLKLQRAFEGQNSNIWKKYGTIKGVYLEKTYAATESALEKLDPHEHNKELEKLSVHGVQTPYKLHFNVEKLSEEMQEVFAERQLEQMKNTVQENEIRNITYTFLHESVFRSQLNMPIRKLGFDSFFQRYNDDRGVAVFFLKPAQAMRMENSNSDSYSGRA